MISNYFTLAALVREWDDLFRGATIRDVYSPHRDELCLELDVHGVIQSLRVSIRSGFHFAFRSERSGRPKANVTTLFPELLGERITGTDIHPSDRIVFLRVSDGSHLEIHLYGSRANIFRVSRDVDDARIRAAFKKESDYVGKLPPEPKSLPDAALHSELQGVERNALEPKLAQLRPRFGKTLIREVVFRADLSSDGQGPVLAEEVDRLAKEIADLALDLEHPETRQYRTDPGELLSLVKLRHLDGVSSESFETVDEGVRVTVQMRSRRLRLERELLPLVKALERECDRARRRVGDLERAIQAPSRAEEYEKWGHLLMANPRAVIDGESVTVPDLLEAGDDVSIPIRQELSVIENAERFYARARGVRTERATLTDRLEKAIADRDALDRLLTDLADIDDLRSLERFRKKHDATLARLLGGRSDAAPESLPFRRFRIQGGFEVWVGRNAKENDRLTFEHASPHDLWFHARGAPGSHVVLRVPGRKTVVPKPAQEEGAAIAAWFSSARGSGLVPVIVTPKKFVSKPKGAEPGAVRVLREEVLLVEAHLPTDYAGSS